MKFLIGNVLLWTAALLQVADGAYSLVDPGQVIVEMAGQVTIPILIDPANIAAGAPIVQILASTVHVGTDAADLTPLSTDPFQAIPVAGGDTIVNVIIDILDDEVYENDETFTLTIDSGAYITPFGTTESFTLVIKDDQLQPVSLLVPQPFFPWPEHQGQLPFVIFFEDETPRLVDYPFWITFSGSALNGADAATSGVDFTPVIEDEPLTIPAGQTWTSISFNITDDGMVENSEHILITLYGASLVQNYTTSVYIKDNDELRYFSCERYGQTDCGNNGTCNKWTCNCECDPGFQGYDCSIETTQVVSPPTPCNTPCLNGTCVDDAGTHKCVCDEGFSGLACEKSAYHVTCNENEMMVCLDIAGDFQGKVYLNGKPECVLNETTNLDCNGIFRSFSLTDMGDCVPTFNNETDPMQNELTVFIQFNPNGDTGDNQVVLMHCHHQGAGNYTDGVADPGNEAIIVDPPTVEPVTHNPVITVTGVIDAGTSTLRDQFQNSITPITEVEAGSVLQYCFTAKDTTGGFRFEEIVLYNGIEEGSSLYDFRILFNPDGCRFNPTDGIVLTDIAGSLYKKCFNFVAVKLLHTSVNQIRAQVRIYSMGEMFTDNLCGGATRKKRQTQTGESEGIQGTVGASYTIKETTSTETQQLLQECERSLMLPATIGLAIVCFTLLVIVILLAATVIRNNKYKSQK